MPLAYACERGYCSAIRRVIIFCAQILNIKKEKIYDQTHTNYGAETLVKYLAHASSFGNLEAKYQISVHTFPK